MEVKYAHVKAEKLRNGRIVYRGKKPRRSRWIMAISLVLAAIITWMIAAHLANQYTPAQPDVVSCVSMQPENSEQVRSVIQACEIVISASSPTDECQELTSDDQLLEHLALVIYQEAGGDACSDDTRQMVGEVAMNRVACSWYPDTLEEVLLQKQQYGRLYWTGLVWPERASKPDEAHAVQRAYDIAKIVLSGENRILPDDVIFQAEFPQGVEIVAEADGFYFCR